MGDVSKKNPLEVPEILENILEYLPLKDLKLSRLVNKFWRDCGIAPMKKKEKIGVRVGYLKYPVGNKAIDDLAKVSKCFNSVAGGYASFPCSKFFLSPALIFVGKRNNENFAEFLEKINLWATELRLSFAIQQRDFIASYPRRVDFPNLKLLKIFTPCIQYQQASRDSSKKFYQFVTGILEKAPSLQKVEIKDDEDSLAVDSIINAKSSFTEMTIYAIRNNSIEKFSGWNRVAKLKSLNLSFLPSEINSASLFQFLRSQKDSLETLVLYFIVSSPIIVSFPEMPKLKNLTIDLNLFYEHDDSEEDDKNAHDLVTFPVISYRLQFPALKSLHLNPWNREEISLCKHFLKHDMQPVPTVEELTLPRSEIYDESLIIAQNAVRIFPNLKKLKMVADSAMLPTIFQNWTNLEQLTFYHYPGRDCIDDLLMRFTFVQYCIIRYRMKKEEEGKDFDWNKLEPGSATESIVNLQKLRVLRFINEMECRELEVTKASLHLILSRIGSLRCIDFGKRRYPMDTVIDKAWCAERNEDCVVLWDNIQ